MCPVSYAIMQLQQYPAVSGFNADTQFAYMMKWGSEGSVLVIDMQTMSGEPLQ